MWNYRAWTEMVLKTAPPELQRPILAEVAEFLGFRYERSEPLRLDAVFSNNPGRDFPLQVAIEHENNPSNFWCAIERLFLVRCPLKVGITYSSADGTEGYFGRVLEWAAESHRQMHDTVGEESGTEYLFLIGVESQKQEIAWNFLEFIGSDGPHDKVFQTAGPPSYAFVGLR